MEIARLLLLLVLAPAFYFAVGLPWAVLLRRVAWAPLFGIGALGFAAELACVAGRPVGFPLLVIAGLHLIAGGWLVWRGRVDAVEVHAGAADFALAYALALVPLVAAPFALPGGWGGDWLMALEAGRHVYAGERFPSELLARPPLFGAAAIPLLGSGSPAAAYQIFCAVASACVLQVFPAGRRSSWWVLAGSVFFLQITANAWPKFLCAAFLLAAWQAVEAPARRRAVLAGALFGLAMATHQSAVLFAPLIFYRLWRGRPAGGGKNSSGLVAAALVAALIVLPWEIHTVAVYGWAAKWQASPAVSQRLAEIPAWLNALLVGITTFVAWGPVEIFVHWFKQPDRFTLLRSAHEVYWLATAAWNSLAGCLLGLVLPWWVAWRGEFWRRAAAAWRGLDGGVRAGLALALAGQIFLNPFYSAEGSLQTGWVPVGVAVALWFAGEAAAAPPERRRRLAWCTGLLAAGPWLAFNLCLTAALELAPEFRRSFVDTDLQALERHGWTSLALGGFPWVQLALAGCWFALWVRRRVAAPSAPVVARPFRSFETT